MALEDFLDKGLVIDIKSDELSLKRMICLMFDVLTSFINLLGLELYQLFMDLSRHNSSKNLKNQELLILNMTLTRKMIWKLK